MEKVYGPSTCESPEPVYHRPLSPQTLRVLERHYALWRLWMDAGSLAFETYGQDLFDAGTKTNHSFSMFDKVNGTDACRKAFESGKSAAATVASWKAGENAFREKRKKYLLY
jgi:hypothetical protein